VKIEQKVMKKEPWPPNQGDIIRPLGFFTFNIFLKMTEKAQILGYFFSHGTSHKTWVGLNFG
jgi:hypothetical protein